MIEDCKSAKNPKAYRIKHQAEYQLHDSLKKELQDLGVTKIPSSNKIQKQIENLESEQTSTVREKQELQKKLKTLEIIQQNFTALLNAPLPVNENLSAPLYKIIPFFRTTNYFSSAHKIKRSEHSVGCDTLHVFFINPLVKI